MLQSADLHRDVWRASDRAHATVATVPAGHAALSAWLPDEGWPLGQLIEILTDRPGCGELSLLVPAMLALSGKCPIVLLRPPLIPNMQAWQQWQIDLHRLWWIQPAGLHDAWWSAEQILRSQCAAALLCWADPIDARLLRRLHLSAQASDTLFVMFRPRDSASLFSPAVLRLELIADSAQGPSLRLLKSRGPKPAHDISLRGEPGSVSTMCTTDSSPSAETGARSNPQTVCDVPDRRSARAGLRAVERSQVV
ncbi:translesion DNA synthesis-associated protein ImuA [Orrella marina]|uniref:Translesion DNA synthesis-associated protein ImuA n=1 Tax=Orrella marina TaxID=2163011 RepID=A0A2R4XHL3_9BURK|nr:translesion DNA synthesis-associated protein ImuA [Orrella marina]AWB33209.1 translesion DNA synthesis-associated protein ImuA [Orrella marina]